MRIINAAERVVEGRAVWAWVAVIVGLSGIAGFAAPHTLPHTPTYRIDYKDAGIHIRRIAVIDGKPGAHVWEVTGMSFGAYASLYSPKLRRWLSNQPAGTFIGQEIDPAAPTIVGVYPDKRELEDFKSFCKAHSLFFSELPVT